MSKELVPIKVKIGLRPNGHADHPDWYKLPLASIEDPANHMFGGWKYDKTSGHKEDTQDSPYGQQWGMLLVTNRFATEAINTFPDLITVMTEAEAEEFWNNKACAHIPENKMDAKLLQSYQSELDLRERIGQDTTALKTKIAKALDPNDPEPGIKKEKAKYWNDAKTTINFRIKEK